MKLNNRQLVDNYAADTPLPQFLSTICCGEYRFKKCQFLDCLFISLLSIMTQKVRECLRE